MKKITNLTESSFLPFIAIILLFQSSPIFSQGTFWNNTGAKITIGKGTYINGPKTTMLNDSNTVIVNQGNIIVEEMKNKGNLELKGTDATIVIDSTLILEKGKI